MKADWLKNNPDLLSQMQAALEMFVFLLLEISILFLLISFLVGLINQHLPTKKVQALLGAQHGKGYLLASGLGALTPFCSCSTIPMLIGLLKARAGFGPTMTFLITSPLLNPIVIALFIPVFGLKVTLIYALIALSIALLAGFVLQILGFEGYVRKELLQQEEKKPCCNKSKANSEAVEKVLYSRVEGNYPTLLSKAGNTISPQCCSNKISEAKAKTPCCTKNVIKKKSKLSGVNWALSWKESKALYRDIFPYMLIAMFIGALVHGFVPKEFFANVAGADKPLAVPTAAIIGIPLYIRVTALLPLVATLTGKGVSLGAIMALTIGAGGASLPELIMLKRLFRWPLLLAFVMIILIMAISAGWIFNLLLT